MSTRPPNESTGPLDHLALRYLRQSLDTAHPADEPYVLNDIESRVIRRTKNATLIIAASLGIMGVLLLYVPQYLWPDLFSSTTVVFMGAPYKLPLITTLYAILLVYIEVNLLVGLNLYGAQMIMRVCQFPNAHDAQYDQHLQALARAASTKTSRGILRFSVDPYLTMPRWGLTIFFLLNMVKAALSNLALGLLLKRLVSRFTLSHITDLAGMPISAFWNVWASWQVLHEAQIRVMSPITIREFVNELHEEWGNNEQLNSLILEALQYVSILKRQYNYSHFLLTETLVDRFNLKLDEPITGNFLEQVANAPEAVRYSLERLIVFGVLVDGKLSRLERNRLRELRNRGFLTTYPTSEIQRIGQEYNQGHGLWV